MGAKCCVPFKEKAPTILREKYEARSRRFSPTLSLRWDNRTHVEDIADNSQVASGGNTEIENSSSDTLRMAKWQAAIAGHSTASSLSNELRGERETNKSQNAAITTCPLRGRRVSRQVSEGKFLPLDSVSEEERPPFMISFCNNDLLNGESYSDGWFINSLPELMLSSQNDNTRHFTSSLQICGLCSKRVKERSSWPHSEISVAAVLVCGHVYHAECLESVTTEASRFDPSCPICLGGESSVREALVRTDWKSRSKNWRRAMADVDADGNFVLERQKNGSYILKDMHSRTGKSFGWPFFKRHLSLGSRPLGLVPKSESSRKRKGLWASYR